MPYKGDPIAEKLDRIAEATGMPRLSRRLKAARPAPPRVVPGVLLASAVAGMALQIARPGWLGFWIVWASWLATNFVFQQLGPLGQPRSSLDEREAAVVRQGHFIGLSWAFGVTVLGALTIALGKMGAMIQLWTVWTPDTGFDWLTVTLFLLSLEFNVAVLAASAATPEPLDDEDE